VALLGNGIAPLAEELSGYGADVHVAEAPVLEHPLAEEYAPVVAEIFVHVATRA
jgi:electron transfer flavoprotein alpha subunit